MYGRCSFPHTTANKWAGFLLFIAVPMTVWSIIPIAIVAAIATLAAIHEGYVVRHKSTQNIPNVWLSRQIYIPSQRQTDKIMKLELATQNDFDAIIAFYDDVTERTPEMATYARWSKGKHPTVEGIKAYIDEGSMYLYRENGAIVGAMAVTMYQGEDYHAIEWTQQVADDKVAVIHILAVSPDAQGKGIGSEMIREAIRMAESKDMQAIRLDALASNTPAHRLYESLGFEYRGKQYLYAENTGWTDFYFFEYKYN